MTSKRVCLICGKDMSFKRGDAKTCGVNCRNTLDRRLENLQAEIARALSTLRILDPSTHQQAITDAFAVLEDKPYMLDVFTESGLTYKSGKALLDTLNAVHMILWRINSDELFRLVVLLSTLENPTYEQKVQAQILLQIQALHAQLSAIDPIQEQIFAKV